MPAKILVPETCFGCSDKEARKTLESKDLCLKCRKKETHRRWRETHPSENAERAKRWREAGNKTTRPEDYNEKEAARKRNLYNSDEDYREKRKEIAYAWRTRNPEKAAESTKNWRKNNVEKTRGYSRDWNAKHRDRCREIGLKWREENPESRAANAARKRKFREEGAENVTNEELSQIISWQQGLCFFCGTKLRKNTGTDNTGKTMEHVIPFEKTGSNKKTNCRYSCGACNYGHQERWIGLEWNPKKLDWSLLSWGCHRSLCDLHKLFPEAEIETFLINARPLKTIKIKQVYYSILSSFAWSVPDESRDSLYLLHKEYPRLKLFWDWEWHKRPQAIENVILAKSGLAERIHARDCEVKEIDWPTARDFLESWHIQGAAPAAIHYALFLGNIICAVISLRKGYLVRYCCNASIPGGLAKILSHAKIEKPLFTFCEPRYGSGEGYLKAGFKQLPDSSVASYGYMQGPFFVPRTAMQKQTMHTVLEKPFLELSEAQNAELNGLRRLDNLPQHRFILE